MPTLKYRDPADGTYKPVPSGGGSSVFADEAERDATVPSPTVGMQCYLVNRKTHTIYRDGAWHPAPSTSTAAMVAEIPAAYPGGVVAAYPALELEWESGCPLGAVSPTNAALFTLTYGGRYLVDFAGTIAVPGDGIIVRTSGILNVGAGNDIATDLKWISYGTMNAHWISVTTEGTSVTNGIFAPPGTLSTAPTGFSGALYLTYLGA